jgi:murein DD-endopeptidase MepM/ murein hydrolase activator NlpD
MKYIVPVPENKIHEWNKRKSPAHFGNLKNSVDFICDVGTDIFAARSGIVVYVKKDFKIGGPNKKFWLCGNRIVIKHKDNEYTAYEHNKYGSTLVNKNDLVKQGQKIAEVGETGFSFEPHLHFEVFVNPSKDESDGITIPVIFDLKRKYSKKCKTSIKISFPSSL